MLRPTSNATHSRVYSSTTDSHFKGRPSLVRSCTKSHVQIWFLYSALRRMQLLSLVPSRRFLCCFVGTFRPSWTHSR